MKIFITNNLSLKTIAKNIINLKIFTRQNI